MVEEGEADVCATVTGTQRSRRRNTLLWTGLSLGATQCSTTTASGSGNPPSPSLPLPYQIDLYRLTRNRISGYTNQASIQVSILTELTTAIRAGKYTGGTGVPEKLVLVGHSFGSVLSAAVVTAQPELAEGLVLTGE